MMFNLIGAVFLVLLTSKTSQSLPFRSSVPCNQAADILLVVDMSSSIWPGYYPNIRTFLKDVVSSFNVGPGPLDSRVGVLTFSTREHLAFHLNRYKTSEDTLKAIDSIQFRGGDTYTNRALEFASKSMLTAANGAREGVAKLVVVLTDGKSANSKLTIAAADTIKARGVDIFAIGVGAGVDFKELNSMASSPSSQYVFQVDDFRALDNIKNLFTQSTCDVLTSTVPTKITETTTTPLPTTVSTTPTSTTTPTTTTPTTTTPTTTTTTTPTTTTSTPTTATTKTPTTVRTRPSSTIRNFFPKRTTTELPHRDQPEFEEGCQGKPADIYFLLDASSSVWIGHFNDRVLPFVRDLVTSFDISPLYTRVGLVTFSTEINHEFQLSDHDDKKSLLAAIQPEHIEYLTGSTNTGDAIEYVTNKGFGAGHARQGVAQIIVTVTDGLSQAPLKTASAAAEARKKGVYMFAVGVGSEVDDQELADIASDPDDHFVFHVDDFWGLSAVTQLLAQRTCKAVARDEPNRPTPITQCSRAPSNIMFVYDSVTSSSSSSLIAIHQMMSEFITDVTLAGGADHFRVGLLTQPCLGGNTGFLALNTFQDNLVQLSSRLTITYTDLIRQLRVETFHEVPMVQQRVAVLVLDSQTQNLPELVKEVLRLKYTNVKIIALAVGKVEELALQQLVSSPVKDHVIRVDSYEEVREAGQAILSILCGEELFTGEEGENEAESKSSLIQDTTEETQEWSTRASDNDKITTDRWESNTLYILPN